MKRKEWAIPPSFLAVLCAALTMMWSGQMFAQAGIDTGSLTGAVKDSSGAVVQKAQCTLTNQDTGVTQNTVTTSAGVYVYSLVPVGNYTLKVTAPNFKEYVLTGIVIHLGDIDTEDVSLQVGSVTAAVTVTSAAPLLQAQDASLGTTVDNTAITELPLFGGSNGRQFEALAQVAPGVQFTGNNQNVTTGLLVHGVTNGELNVVLNGADDNVEVFGGVSIPPVMDAIQEFKLEDGSNPADVGEFYGPLISVSTKQGTNKFQGAVWEYNENDMYDANDYFNKRSQLLHTPAPLPNRPGRYKENSFGGVFGGPVILPRYNGRNKTFFTVDFQRTNYSQVDYASSFETVPTALMQSSNFTNLSDTLTLNYQPAGGTGNPLSSEKEDGLGRYFQVGMMLDPATTRAVACGSMDPITGLMASCSAGYTVVNPNNVGGAGSTQKYAVVRDPFLSGAGGCPGIMGTTNFNSAYNTGNNSQPVYPVNCFNQLPAGRLDANAVKLLQLFPKANEPNPSGLSYGNNYFTSVQQPTFTTQYDVRIDQTFSARDSVFGVFSYWLQTTPGASPFNNVLEGSGTNFANRTPAYVIPVNWNHVFSSSLVNAFRFSYENQKSWNFDPYGIDNQTANGGIPAQYGIQGIPQAGAYGLGNGGLPDFPSLSSITSFGSRTNITTRNVGAWQYSDDLTKIKGRHEWKFGGEWLWTFGNIAQMPNSRGNFGYGGTANVPNSGDNNGDVADFLLLPGTNVASGAYTAAGVNALSTSVNEIGGVSSFTGNNFNYSTYHAPYLAFYTTDNWKITPKLTAAVGIRYEWFGPYYSVGGQEANLWMGGSGIEAGDTASGTAFHIAHDGCATTLSPFFIGLLAYDQIPIICEPNNAANKTQKANWGPHIGFAYRITPRIVARIGAGVQYGGFGSIGYGGTLGTNYPFRFTVNSSGGFNAFTPNLIGTVNATTGLPQTTATMENTFQIISLSNPSTAYLPLGGIALYGKQYHFKTPHSTTMDFAVQWQFTNHDSVEARYVGQLGADLESADPYNNAPSELLTSSTTIKTIGPQTGACAPYCATGFIPFPNLNALTGPMENTETVSSYQSGEAEYKHQFANGFNMDANYTYASCLSDAQGGQQAEGGPGNGRAPWVTGYRYDYDRCESTAANIFKLYGEYNLPFGKGALLAGNANGLVDAIIGGWKIDPIWQAWSGFLQSISCQGANGYTSDGAPSATFTGPWFASGTAWSCEAPHIPGEHLYGPGPNDLPKTRVTGYWNSSAWTAPGPVLANGQSDLSPLGVRADQIYGPGWYAVDLAVHKQFKVFEETKFEVGAQASNAFNHVHLNPNPGTSNYTSPGGESITGGFGTITGSQNISSQGRIIQFDGKFFF
jgi:hypothetical protein